MSKTITRRDILKFTGGGILGMMFSPLPWKLLDDSAIWTQNWSLTPALPHGPITTLFSHCTLCGGGCAFKAKCISGMPYYLSQLHDHSVTHGTLCPRGIAGHHMAYHPLRIVHPHRYAGKSGNSSLSPVSLNDALTLITEKIQSTRGAVAVLDQQPGRMISQQYRTFLKKLPNGLFLTSPSREDATNAAIQAMTHRPKDLFGFDFEHSSLIVSFGAPLLDGFGTPGRISAAREQRGTKIVQVECRQSRTAMQADQWIPVLPGGEQVLASSILAVLIHEKGISGQIRDSAVNFSRIADDVKAYLPEQVISLTGIQPSVVRNLANELSSSPTPIVLSGADPGGGPYNEETERAVALLNLFIGSVGKRGGIISLRNIPGYEETETARRWSSIPDRSIGCLIVDGADSGYALPWEVIRKKMIPEESFVVSFSPILNEISAHADLLIPSPAHMETLHDIPTPPGSGAASFALAVPLLPKPVETTEPSEILRNLSERLHLAISVPEQADALKQVVEKIFQHQRGTIHRFSDQQTVEWNTIGSADELWTILYEGAVWLDAPMPQRRQGTFEAVVPPPSAESSAHAGIPMLAYGWRGATSSANISPILSKLFQETELRDGAGTISVHPETGKRLGLEHNRQVTLSTSRGSIVVRTQIRPTVRPGTIEASIGPLPNGAETPVHPAGTTMLSFCDISADGTWRMTTANILKA